MKLSKMRVGSDYFVTNERNWVAAQGQRVRLLSDRRVRAPHRYLGGNQSNSIIVRVEGQDMEVPGLAYVEDPRPGEDMYVVAAEVHDDGHLDKPKAVFLQHIAGPWEACAPAAAAFRAAMDQEERERLDRQHNIATDLQSILGEDADVAIDASGTARIDHRHLRTLINRVKSA
jgi:hypothetical protein